MTMDNTGHTTLKTAAQDGHMLTCEERTGIHGRPYRHTTMTCPADGDMHHHGHCRWSCSHGNWFVSHQSAKDHPAIRRMEPHTPPEQTAQSDPDPAAPVDTQRQQTLF